MPGPQLTTITSIGMAEFSYHLNAQGLEGGHLLDAVATFTTVDDVSAYMAVVAGPGFGPCIANSKKDEVGQTPGAVTTTAAPKVQVVPMPKGASGTHFHISFPYSFRGAPKTAEEDLYFIASGRMRAWLGIDTCCTPFDPAAVDLLAGVVNLQMAGAQA